MPGADNAAGCLPAFYTLHFTLCILHSSHYLTLLGGSPNPQAPLSAWLARPYAVTMFPLRVGRQTAVRAATLVARLGLDLVYPRRLLGCEQEIADGRGTASLCEACATALQASGASKLGRCGAILAERRPRPGRVPLLPRPATGIRHGYISRQVRRALAADGFEDEAAGARIALRFLGPTAGPQRQAALGELSPTLVVPIPMHWWRRLVRGTNSPEILARCLAEQLHVPVGLRLLCRCRHTVPQKDLLPRQRLRTWPGPSACGRGWRAVCAAPMSCWWTTF